MQGYLRTKGVNGDVFSRSAEDVTVDFSDGADLTPGSEVQVRVTEANAPQGAYIVPQYPTFEVPGIIQLGARIVTPRTGIPGFVPIGTILTIRLV